MRARSERAGAREIMVIHLRDVSENRMSPCIFRFYLKRLVHQCACFFHARSERPESPNSPP